MKTDAAPPLRPFVVLVHSHFEFSLELTPFTFPIQFLASPCGIIPRMSELAEFVFGLGAVVPLFEQKKRQYFFFFFFGRRKKKKKYLNFQILRTKYFFSSSSRRKKKKKNIL